MKTIILYISVVRCLTVGSPRMVFFFFLMLLTLIASNAARSVDTFKSTCPFKSSTLFLSRFSISFVVKPTARNNTSTTLRQTTEAPKTSTQTILAIHLKHLFA